MDAPAVTLAFLARRLAAGRGADPHRVVGELFQGITTERDWIDRAVGRDADVAALWSGRLDRLTIFENEFFNRSVGEVHHLRDPIPAGLRSVRRRSIARPGGSRSTRRTSSSTSPFPIVGTEVARDETKGMRLIRAARPVRLRYATTGLYDDGWSASGSRTAASTATAGRSPSGSRRTRTWSRRRSS